ncbi:tyrosine-protein phosphatase [Pontibacillus salicampi]|uniref:Tyrosine-protein phosphatase n=1 Tax=Pontibacillus salicampi TaxID=1449801 RepID=A0ABV6LSU0_9BACI
MIDIHCHILPGLDDGPETTEASVNLARTAYEEGIHTIVATPHHNMQLTENEPHTIVEALSALRVELEKHHIPLELIAGQEVRIHDRFMEDLEEKRILPIHEESNYIYVELPKDHVPSFTSKLLYDVQIAGYKPVLVHPERNKELLESPDELYKLVKYGVYTQLTAASLCGENGKRIEKFSKQMVEANLAHFIASGANKHSTTFFLSEAYKVVAQAFGEDMRRQFMVNAEKIVAGEEVSKDMPERIKQKKLLGIFPR